MPIEGPLRELSIHDVFQLLDLSRKTGTLRVTSELREDEGWVEFDKGRVVAVSIRSKPGSLGSALVRAGRISSHDLEDAERERQSAGAGARGIGEILVARGAIGARELERQARLQMETVVFELMSWREGFFSFEEHEASDVVREASVHISTESLLMEGARRIDEWSRMADRLPTVAVVPVLSNADSQSGAQLDLRPGEWEVLAAIDGAHDVSGIAASLGRSEFDVARVVYGLLATGVLVIEAPAPTPASAAANTEPADPNVALEQAKRFLGDGQAADALRAVQPVIAREPALVEARLIAARALRRLKRFGDAAEELRRALEVAPAHPGLRLEQGFAALSRGDFAAAVANWEQYLERGEAKPTDDEDVRRAVASASYLGSFLEAYTGG